MTENQSAADAGIVVGYPIPRTAAEAADYAEGGGLLVVVNVNEGEALTFTPADVREYDENRAPGEPLEFVAYVSAEEHARAEAASQEEAEAARGTMQERQERAAQRALTEDALTAAKLDDARRALAALQSTQVLLPHGEAVAFGRALNDVRLVLATRLGIETDEDAARVHAVDDWRRAEDLESTMALLYNFTTWFLETLMEEMLTELPLEGDAGADGGRA